MFVIHGSNVMYFRRYIDGNSRAMKLYDDGEDVSVVEDSEMSDNLPSVIVDMDRLSGMECFDE